MYTAIGIDADDVLVADRNVDDILPVIHIRFIFGDQTGVGQSSILIQDDRKTFSLAHLHGRMGSQVGQFTVGVGSRTIDTGIVIDIDDCRFRNGKTVDVFSCQIKRPYRVLQDDKHDKDRHQKNGNDRRSNLVVLIKALDLVKYRFLGSKIFDIDLIGIGLVDFVELYICRISENIDQIDMI